MFKSFSMCFAMVFLLLSWRPDQAYAQLDCFTGLIEPTEDDLEKYNIRPWYPDQENLSSALDAVIQLHDDDYDVKLLEVKATEIIGSKEEKEKQKHGNSGSLESEIILGLTDFIVDRAKAEMIQWYMDDMQANLCEGEYYEYFLNTCVLRAQSKETLPYLPVLVEAFRKDLEIMPANLLCKNFKTDKGYYLTNLIRHIIGGVPVQNTIAGLAQNKSIAGNCKSEELSSKGSTCDLYMTGLLAKAYIAYKGKKDWNGSKKIIDDELSRKNITLGPDVDDAVRMQYLLRLAGIFKDIELQVKKVKRARKEGNQSALVASSTIKIGEDLMELIYNPYVLSIKGIDKSTKNHIKPTITAVSAISAGQYSDALLDINRSINVYFEDKLKDIYFGLQNEIIEIVMDSGNMLYKEEDYKNSSVFKSICTVMYRNYYPAETAECNSVTGLNKLLEKSDFFEQALRDKEQYENKINALIMIYYDMDNKKQKSPYTEFQKKLILRILNRLVLEKKDGSVPKSDFCYGALLEAYYTWYNPDLVITMDKNKYLSVNDKYEEMKKGLSSIVSNMKSNSALPKKCTLKLDSLANGKELNSSENVVQKYVPVIASLATANNKDEVKNILNETAAAVGSWRIKQKKESTQSIGALFGYNLGYEYLKNSTNDGFATGLFVPVGFDYTTKHCLVTERCGIFLSVLDLGTVATARIDNRSEVSNKDKNYHFSQVVSPGLYFHWNFKKSPLLFGLGWSYVPLLRVEVVNNEPVEKGGSRVLMFFAIDLPLYFL